MAAPAATGGRRRLLAAGDRLDRRLAIAIAAIATVGVAVAAYLTYVHYAGIDPVCASGGGGCHTVQKSDYAELAGIPVALLGLLGYVGILGSLLLLRPPSLSRAACAVLALSGFGFSMYLTYREIFTIKAICQWCVGSAVLMTALAVLTTIRLVRDEDF
jgi:uncharacterized membrane protein